MIKLALVLLSLAAAPAQTLKLSKTIPLPGVEGRIDHLSVDIKGRRLFVAALGNNSLEIIDLNAGSRIQSVKNLHEPQGILYWPEANKIFIASAGDGLLRVFDGTSFQLIKSIDFNSDADNVRMDLSSKEILLGYGDGALGFVNVTESSRVGEVMLDGHPESFQLEKSGPRIFINVPNAANVTVVDRRSRSVVAKWPVTDAKANFPMALDEANHRLFIGCRKPAQLRVFDTNTGKVVATAPIPGDADDLFYDAAAKRLYVSGGEGSIGIIAQRDADHYTLVENLPTASGARTSLFVPELKQFYLAVPHRGKQPAEIRAYTVE